LSQKLSITICLPGIKTAIEELLTVKLPAKSKRGENGSLSYLNCETLGKLCGMK